MTILKNENVALSILGNSLAVEKMSRGQLQAARKDITNALIEPGRLSVQEKEAAKESLVLINDQILLMEQEAGGGRVEGVFGPRDLGRLGELSAANEALRADAPAMVERLRAEGKFEAAGALESNLEAYDKKVEQESEEISAGLNKKLDQMEKRFQDETEQETQEQRFRRINKEIRKEAENFNTER